jgi:hypothetical protein
MTLAMEVPPGEPPRDAKKARAAQGEEPNQLHKREGASRCSHFITGVATAPPGEQ